MKKKLMIVMAIVAILEVSGLVTHLADPVRKIPEKNRVYLQLGVKGEEFALEQLEGCRRKDLIRKWGQPDGMLSGLYGDIWNLTQSEAITVYYSDNSKVEHLLITAR